MNTKYITMIGAIGGILVSAFGGWDYYMQLLVISMCVDYISGVLVAAVWHRSSKSKDGSLESRAGFKGLIRKGMILLTVLVAHYMDLTIGSQYIRNALVIGFSANEILSILENVGLMGVEYPEVMKQAIEALKKKDMHADV
mgnify:FL=1